MRKQNSWKIYSHVSRMNKLVPSCTEYKGIFSGTFESTIPFHQIIKYERDSECSIVPPRITLKTPPYTGKTVSSREISLSVLLEENKLKQDERSLVVHEIVDRVKNMSNEQLITLLTRQKYQTSYLAHATDVSSTQQQVIELELRERLYPRPPQKLVTFHSYTGRSSSLLNKIGKEREKEARKELKRKNLNIEQDALLDMFETMLENRKK